MGNEKSKKLPKDFFLLYTEKFVFSRFQIAAQREETQALLLGT